MISEKLVMQMKVLFVFEVANNAFHTKNLYLYWAGESFVLY